jgi:uncharacterized protein YndB with AHSA1/START domain
VDIELDILVECPVEQAFLACTSAEHQVRWMASLMEVEIDPGKDWGVGSSFRQIHEISGMRQVFDGVVLDLQDNRRISTHLKHDDFTIFTDLTFRDLGERCQLNQSTKIELKSVALKLMRGAVGNAVRDRLKADLDRLKVLLEED